MHMFIMNNHVSLLLQLSSILILFYILPAIHLSKFQTVRSSGQKPFFFCAGKVALCQTRQVFQIRGNKCSCIWHLNMNASDQACVSRDVLSIYTYCFLLKTSASTEYNPEFGLGVYHYYASIQQSVTVRRLKIKYTCKCFVGWRPLRFCAFMLL